MGLSIDAMVSRVFARYDRNNNDIIKAGGKTDRYGVSHLPETMICKTQLKPDGMIQRDCLNLSPMFKAADADGSKYVTRQELRNLLSTYDADHNGRIEGREAELLSQDFPETATTEKYRAAYSLNYVDPGSDNQNLNEKTLPTN